MQYKEGQFDLARRIYQWVCIAADTDVMQCKYNLRMDIQPKFPNRKPLPNITKMSSYFILKKYSPIGSQNIREK